MPALRTGLVLLVLAAAAGRSAADMPPPEGLKRPHTITYRIELAHGLPDYVALVYRNDLYLKGGGADRVELIDMAGARRVEVSGHRPNAASVTLVPKSLAAGHATAAEVAKAVRDRPPGVAELNNLHFSEFVPIWGPGHHVITYELRRGPSGERCEVVRTSFNPLWQCWVVGITLPAGLVWLGMRQVRRRRARRDR